MFRFIKKLFSSIACKENDGIAKIKKSQDFLEADDNEKPNIYPELKGYNNNEVIEKSPAEATKPNITNNVEQELFSLNADNKPLAQIHIGLDFGTSFTKGCWYYLDKDQRYIVQWDSNWILNDPYFLPSQLWLDDHNILSMKKIPGANQRAIRFFKMMVAEQPIGESIIPKEIQTLINPYYLYTSFFISRCLSWIQQSALKTERRLRNCHVEWTGNIGIPISYFESDLRNVFDEIINAAYYMLKNNISDSEPMKRIQELYQEACSIEYPKYFTSVPELYAESIGLFSDYHTPEGFYTIFDVGGGTVDGAVLEFHRHDGLPKVNFLTSSIKPLGIEVISTSSNEAQLELKNQMMTQTAELIIKAKNKVFSHWKRKGRLPIMMCGGGHSSEWHIKAIEQTYYHRQHYNCGIPKYEIQDLQVSLIDINNLPNCNKHRFLTAIGLSYLEGMGPDIIGFPKTNPEFVKFPETKTIDLDERQRELYGEC